MISLLRRFLVSALVAACMFHACLAAENPLIGSWMWDNRKTLENLRSPEQGSDALKASAAKARKFVEATISKTGSMTLTYSDREYVEILYDHKGNVLSRSSHSYSVVEMGKDFVIVDQMQGDGIVKVFFQGDSYFVEVRIGEYTYNDYFTRLKK